jgi:hypothetical protein
MGMIKMNAVLMLTIFASLVDDAFTALFYGAGSWLGLLLMIALIAGLVSKWKLAGGLFIPVSIFMGINYFNHDLGWHGLIMFLVAIFVLIYMAFDSD